MVHGQYSYIPQHIIYDDPIKNNIFLMFHNSIYGIGTPIDNKQKNRF